TNPQARLNVSISLILFVLSYIFLIIVAIPFTYILIPMDEIKLPAGLEHGMTGFIGVLATITLNFLSLKKSNPLLMSGIGFVVITVIILAVTYLFIWLSARKIDKGIKIDMVSESKAKPLFKRKSGGSLY